MDLQQIEKLVQIIENSSMLEFSIQEGDTKIKMSRRGTAGVPGEAAVTIAQTAPAAQAEEESEDSREIVMPSYTADELIRKAIMAGDEPDIVEDKDLSLTLLDYTDCL